MSSGNAESPRSNHISFLEKIVADREPIDEVTNKKPEILLHFHELLHKEMQEHRESSVKLTISVCTVIVAVAAWTIANAGNQSPGTLAFIRNALVVVGVVGCLSMLMLRNYFLEVGFGIRNIEMALGAYRQGFFYKPDNGPRLYKDRWAEFGESTWFEPIFAICLFSILLFSGFGAVSIHRSIPVPNAETEKDQVVTEEATAFSAPISPAYLRCT